MIFKILCLALLSVSATLAHKQQLSYADALNKEDSAVVQEIFNDGYAASNQLKWDRLLGKILLNLETSKSNYIRESGRQADDSFVREARSKFDSLKKLALSIHKNIQDELDKLRKNANVCPEAWKKANEQCFNLYTQLRSNLACTDVNQLQASINHHLEETRKILDIVKSAEAQ